MTSMSRSLGVFAALVAVGATLTACAGSAEKTVAYTESVVALAAGETLVVDFGEINPSVGDDWAITKEPDPGVLGEGDSEFTTDAPDGMTGAPGELVYRFPTTGAGTTVIAFEYRFQGEVPKDADDQKTAEITVTVK